MIAGKALDALVAEKVMGLKVEYGTFDCKCCKGESFHLVDGHPPAPYSTDIAAAWMVIDRLLENHKIYLRTSEVLVPGWEVEITYGLPEGVQISCHARTATHAICLAALKACGVEIK